jgi:thiol-disulfide isomerase/thioredoxin
MNTWIIVLIILILCWIYYIPEQTYKQTKIISPVAESGALPRTVINRSKLISNIKSKFGKMNSNSKFNTSLTYSPDNTKMENITNDTVLIFYAPWCGHCKKSMNDFKKAASIGNGKIMLINSDQEPETIKKYNVRGFPTIMKGNGEIYTGSRDVSSIVEFANS